MAELIMLKFDSTYGAQSAMASVRALEELDYAWTDDVAIVEKHKGGLVSIHTPHGSVALGGFLRQSFRSSSVLVVSSSVVLGRMARRYGRGSADRRSDEENGLDEELVDQVKSELTRGPQRSC